MTYAYSHTYTQVIALICLQRAHCGKFTFLPFISYVDCVLAYMYCGVTLGPSLRSCALLELSRVLALVLGCEK